MKGTGGRLGRTFVADGIKIITLLLAVSIIAFALVTASPVDPVQQYIMGIGPVSEEQRIEIEDYWGSNDPPVERYFKWLSALLHGDFGTSLLYRRPVIDIISERFQNSLALTDKRVRHDLFLYNHPVFTRVRDRVPSYYGEECEIENCIVADGCMLEGEAEHSVLFRQVTIEAGAEVEDCIIMNDTVIGAGSQLKYVILDKDVTVRPGSKLIGTPTNPIIVRRGEIV